MSRKSWQQNVKSCVDVRQSLVHVIFGVLKSGKMYDPNYEPAFT